MTLANRIIDTDTNDIVTHRTVMCPICELVHDLRNTKNKGTPFFVCNTCGNGTIVFIRSRWATERLKQWTSHAKPAPVRCEAEEDRTGAPSKEAEALEKSSSNEVENSLRRLVKEWSIRPVKRRASRH